MNSNKRNVPDKNKGCFGSAAPQLLIKPLYFLISSAQLHIPDSVYITQC